MDDLGKIGGYTGYTHFRKTPNYQRVDQPGILGPFGPQAGVSAGVLGLALGLREAKRQRGSRWTVEEVPGFWAGYLCLFMFIYHPKFEFKHQEA